VVTKSDRSINPKNHSKILWSTIIPLEYVIFYYVRCFVFLMTNNINGRSFRRIIRRFYYSKIIFYSYSVCEYNSNIVLWRRRFNDLWSAVISLRYRETRLGSNYSDSPRGMTQYYYKIPLYTTIQRQQYTKFHLRAGI